MTRFVRLVVFLTSLSVTTTGCATPTIQEMRDEFQRDMKSQVGSTLTELTANDHRFIGARKPTGIRRLPSGNLLHIYGGYWTQYQIESAWPCTVFLEVDPNTDIITSIYSKGKNCLHVI